MKSIFDTVNKILLKHKELKSEDGKLLKNKAIELAHKLNEELIKVLLENSETKKQFFKDVANVTIFNIEEFVKFVSNKEFLPDSYTAFKNKIGLMTGDEYLSENKSVVLTWPYKDCVLEGGMTKEDQKRDEVFYNETLAPDEIDRLLDPKVFTNFKRIDKKGEHKLDGFKRDEKGNIKDNLIIKGNNLLALASLKKEFAGKVKLIYIDPPFNTGGDSFNYNDRFNHSSWLTFMRNRLEISKQLLASTGTIFIHCDENESHYLKVLLDEVFGREKFVNEIIWHYRSFVGQVKSYFPKKHDTILLYKNGENFTFKQVRKDIPIEEMSDYKNWGKYIVNGKEIRGDYYPLDVRFKRNLDKWKDEHSDKKPTKDDILYIFQSQPEDDVWDIEYLDPKNKTERLDFKGGQKPEALLKRIIESVTEPGDLVLDYHAGTGTTGVVAHKMKRQYILIEQMDHIHGLLEARLKRVIKSDQSGISKEVNWQGSGDFVYMELAKWNKEWTEKIEKTKTNKELAKLWGEMRETAFLSYKVEPKTIDANIKDFADLSISDQKRFLFECLDKNQLYINYSEIEDKEYGVSKEDMKLNKEFYGK